MTRQQQRIVDDFRANLRAGYSVSCAGDLATMEIDADLGEFPGYQEALAWWNCEADWNDYVPVDRTLPRWAP